MNLYKSMHNKTQGLWKREVHWSRHTDIGWYSRGIFSQIRVHLGTPSCTCQDWLIYHLPCKHFYAIFKLVTEWSWDKLPKEYVNSPRLSHDKDVLHSALVADKSAHITEQSSLFDYEETVASLEDFPKLWTNKTGMIHNCIYTCTLHLYDTWCNIM